MALSGSDDHLPNDGGFAYGGLLDASGVISSALRWWAWWQQAFLGIGPRLGGGNESENLYAASQVTACATERFSPRPRLLNLSDQMELAAGRLTESAEPLAKPRCVDGSP